MDTEIGRGNGYKKFLKDWIRYGGGTTYIYIFQGKPFGILPLPGNIQMEDGSTISHDIGKTSWDPPSSLEYPDGYWISH